VAVSRLCACQSARARHSPVAMCEMWMATFDRCDWEVSAGSRFVSHSEMICASRGGGADWVRLVD
jgi:hypothetical protein